VLALVEVQPEAALAGAELLFDLPNPPAPLWSGFLIQVGGRITLARVTAWALEMRDARPAVPIGLAVDLAQDDGQTLSALARVGLRFNLVLDSRHLGGVDLTDALDALRGASVEQAILHSWLARWQPAAEPREGILIQIIAHGVRGGKTKSLHVMDAPGRVLSPSTVQRLLRKAGLPAPGWLLRDARLTGARLRETRGLSATDASLAAGFSSYDSRRRAEKRRATPG
jgi:hypothetical protein